MEIKASTKAAWRRMLGAVATTGVLALLAGCASSSGATAPYNGYVPDFEVGVIHGGRLYVSDTPAFRRAHEEISCTADRLIGFGVVFRRSCRRYYAPTERPEGNYVLSQIRDKNRNSSTDSPAKNYSDFEYLPNNIYFAIESRRTTIIDLPPLAEGACFQIGLANDPGARNYLGNLVRPVRMPVNVRRLNLRKLRVPYLSTFEPPRRGVRPVALSQALCRHDRLRAEDIYRIQSREAYNSRNSSATGIERPPQ